MKKLPDWQKAQHKKKEAKKIKLAINSLFLLLLIIFIASGYLVSRLIVKSVWDGKSSLTVVANSSPVLLISYSKVEEKLILLAIPENTYLETVRGYGFYQVGFLWKLGKMENLSGELLASTLQACLGVSVDGWLSDSIETISFANKFSTEERKKFILEILSRLINGGETNLSQWDIVRLWWQIKKVRFSQIDYIDLAQTSGVNQTNLPDGGQVLMVNNDSLDQLVIKYFSHPKIKQENLSIGVFNSTERSGLASKAARLVNNSGGRLVEVGSWSQKVDQCQIIGSKENIEKYTAKKFKQIFGCQLMASDANDRVDLAIILGEAYWRNLYEK